MLKLNKKLEIGMNAVAVLKKRSDYTSANELADQIGTTVSFIEQIMRNLRISGIVKVKHGPGGGYLLNKQAELTAYTVAKSVGRFTGNLKRGDSAPSQLQRNIIEAFRSTKL